MTPTDTIREQLEEIRKRLDAATPGKWKQEDQYVVCSKGFSIAEASYDPRLIYNAQLIANAPQDLRRLLDALEVTMEDADPDHDYEKFERISNILKGDK